MPKSLNVGLTLILILGLLAFGIVTARRAAKGSNDFDTFYYAGDSVIHGKGIYYTGEYYQTDRTHAPFLYPPFAAILFAPLVFLPLILSAFVWHILCAALFIVALRLCLNLSGLQLGEIANHSDWKNYTGWGIGLVFLLSLLIDNLAMAQVNLCVLSIALTGLCLIKKNKKIEGGAIIASAVALKVTPVIFIAYFLIKRSWKSLAGSLVGSVIFFALIPAVVLGWNQNILLHRQWLGKSFKPALIELYDRIRPEAPHPFKKSVEEWRIADLYNRLTPKNQSMSAVATRLFLKDRNRLANDIPIYVAQRYPKLPVLGGGLLFEQLKTWITLIQTLLIILMFVIFVRRKNEEKHLPHLEIALLFLSMTLFSPLARSHQFIFWMLPILIMSHANSIPYLQRYAKALISSLGVAFLLYLLQAAPYGKAAGMGMWANLILWGTFLVVILKIHSQAVKHNS